MSILLEALRKSEASQKPVEPPNLHRNDHPVHAPGPIKGLHAVLLVVVALAVIGWLLWQQYQPATVGYQPPVELPAGKAGKKVPEVPGTTKTAEVKAPQKPVSKATGGPRTPVETYEMSKAEKDIARQERKQKVAQAARDNQIANNVQARNLAAKQAAARQAAQSAQPGIATKPASGDQAQTVTSPGSNAGNTNPAEEKYQSPEPAPIGYWELPDAIRNSITEIKFSVLVYAEQPESRFVLINGQRATEGDALKPGLVVEEIRRDGVVFSYQLYQFFVER